MVTTLVGVTTGVDILPPQAVLNNATPLTPTPGGWQQLPMDAISQATADVTLVGGKVHFHTSGLYLFELDLNITVTGTGNAGHIGVGFGDSAANPWNDEDMPYPAASYYQLGRHLLASIHDGDELYFLYDYNCGGVATIPANGAVMTVVRLGAAAF